MIHTKRMLTPILILMLLWGCGSKPVRDRQDQPQVPQARPIAIVNGVAISRKALESQLSEAAGAPVLRELILDRALEQRCELLGILIGSDEIEKERLLLGETIGNGTEQAMPKSVLEDLRATRGLGPIRFEQLLKRNAMLRSIVGTVDPSPAQIEQAMDSAFGTRYRVRLFVTSDAAGAHSLRTETESEPPQRRPWVFAERCAASSSHPSSPRGGLIEALSPASSGYPSSLLSALQGMQPGSCSPVISTESGYVLILVEEVIPEIDPNPQERTEIMDQLRRGIQRNAMLRLAQEVLAEQEVIVMDRALHWAWTSDR